MQAERAMKDKKGIAAGGGCGEAETRQVSTASGSGYVAAAAGFDGGGEGAVDVDGAGAAVLGERHDARRATYDGEEVKPEMWAKVTPLGRCFGLRFCGFVVQGVVRCAIGMMAFVLGYPCCLRCWWAVADRFLIGSVGCCGHGWLFYRVAPGKMATSAACTFIE